MRKQESINVFVRPKALTLFITTILLFLISWGVYSVGKSFISEFAYDAPISSYFAILFGCIGLWENLRYRVIITSDWIESRGFRVRRIRFEDVKSITLKNNSLKLTNSQHSIRIGSEISNRDQLYQKVIDSLKVVQNLSLNGNSDELDQYFPYR